MLQIVLIKDRQELINIVDTYKIHITEQLIYQFPISFIGIIHTNERNEIELKQIDHNIISLYNNIYDGYWQ